MLLSKCSMLFPPSLQQFHARSVLRMLVPVSSLAAVLSFYRDSVEEREQTEIQFFPMLEKEGEEEEEGEKEVKVVVWSVMEEEA